MISSSNCKTESRKIKSLVRPRAAFGLKNSILDLLLDKYSGPTFEARMKLDRPFFTQMDSLSKWFSLPYPYKEGDKGVATYFIELHHRAPFNSTYKNNYQQVCAILEKDLMK